MNKPEEIPEYIFDLIAVKSFEDLTLAEREDVLKYMSEDEYQENRMLVADFQEVNSKLQFRL